jgi:hypothetical protein
MDDMLVCYATKLFEMGGLVGSAPAFYGSSLGSNPDISEKIKKMGDISEVVANTLCSPPKNIQKKKKKKRFLKCFAVATERRNYVLYVP